jgi:outer membrane protein, multidrug efflux system
MKHPDNRRAARPIALAGAGVALAGLVLLSGCRVGPEFTVPQTAVPPTWTGSTMAPATPDAAALAQWLTSFNDPLLTSLVGEALQANLDLRLAGSRLRQARAAHRVAAAASGPTLDASGSAQRSQAAAGSEETRGAPTNSYRAGFDAAWELDLFGGVARNREAALADVLSAEESRRAAQVTLVAEVAQTYIDLRLQQQRIAIARKNLEAQQHTVDVTRKRRQGGFVSALDVAGAEAQVATTAAAIPPLEAAVRQTVYALSVLLDREPGALLDRLSAAAPVPTTPPAVPLGVPADLLRRRPDIRAAEANIHAATARIGVATADLFPHVTLGAATGIQAANTGNLVEPWSTFWSLGPSLSWRVFDTGATRANIEVRKALEEQSVLTYRQTVLTALQEVESALIGSTKEEEHRQALGTAVEANRKAVDLAVQLYDAGQTEYLDVLSAQRALYSAEDALAESAGNTATQLITLYKALGGGWEPPAPSLQ